MTTSPMMTPDPSPDDLPAEVELWLQEATQPAEPDAADEDEEGTQIAGSPGSDQRVSPGTVPGGGETKQVRALRAEVAEAHLLLGLQGDEAPLLVDTPKVRKRRMQGAEAARLHALAQVPAVRAWQAARWRSVLTWVDVVALVLALGWSTAGVQKFAAEGAEAWTPGWVFAWLVEPFMSMALLTVVSAKAFMATRGQPLNHPTLRRIEGLFLGLTFGMNAWPHLPGVADKFTVSALVLHLIGPIIAVASVMALPIIWGAFAALDHGEPYSPLTPPKYSGNTAPQAPPVAPSVTPPVGPSTGDLVGRARALIAAGQLRAKPSANALRTALGCGTNAARQVRDELGRQ